MNGDKYLACPDCGSAMIIRESKFGKFYGCITFPKCKASHGAHPDGKPMGVPANAETKKLRIEAHALFDAAWKSKGLVRGQAYAWLADLMHVHKNHAHIAHFNKGECQKLISLLNS